MITYTHCPVCSSEDIHGSFSAKDYTVSHKSFVVMLCSNCTCMFTQDVPKQENIGKYYASEDYISHSDTQKGFVNRLYHIIRKRTLHSKKALIKSEVKLKTGKILDIGCGTGAFLHTMQQAGWTATGLEPDEHARAKAAELYNIEAKPSDELFSMQYMTYDAITMWHVLEHVHQLHEYIAQLKNILSPTGNIFIAVPNYTSFDAQYYKEYWAAYDVPRHLYHFSPDSMKSLLSQHGLILKKIKPMWFDSFYVSMLSEQYKSGKGNIIRAFFIGLRSNMKTMMNKQKCSSLIYVIAKA
jgi:2-polyprenyl-3-methyl-5-hydroxy-6-metoxy-1,4-benzoquinol methylase